MPLITNTTTNYCLLLKYYVSLPPGLIDNNLRWICPFDQNIAIRAYTTFGLS